MKPLHITVASTTKDTFYPVCKQFFIPDRVYNKCFDNEEFLTKVINSASIFLGMDEEEVVGIATDKIPTEEELDSLYMDFLENKIHYLESNIKDAESKISYLKVELAKLRWKDVSGIRCKFSET